MEKSRPDPPVIDSRVEFAGASRLRDFNKRSLRRLRDNVVVIQESGKRIAVLMSYEMYLMLQERE